MIYLFLVIIAVVILVLVIVMAAVGLYFVNFSLKRHKLDYDFPVSTDPSVIENAKQIRLHKEDWLAKTKADTWSLTTKDNLKLVADFYPVQDSHKYAITVHGYTSCKEDMFQFASYFHDWGFNTLVPDNRAHGQSQGKWIGMGWLDSNDCSGWIDKIVKHDSDAQIFLFGISMGGATVMMTSGLNLPDNVKCIVEDCGYSSVWDQFVFNLKDMFHLPSFPVMNISNITARIICRYNFKEASSLKRLKNAKVPMLFIHGTADTFVPYAMLDKNIKAYGGPYKEVLRVKGATHGQSVSQNLKLYLSTVQTFLNRWF